MMKATTVTAASTAVLCGMPSTSAFTQPSFSLASHMFHRPGRTNSRLRFSMSTLSVPPATAARPETSSISIDMEGVQLSGLNGQALRERSFPTKREVIGVIPKHCFERDTMRSMMYAVFSSSATLLIGGLAAFFLPLKVRAG